MAVYSTLNELLGGALFTTKPSWLPGYASPVDVVVPAAGAFAKVFARDADQSSASPLPVYPNEDGSGSPLAQPLVADRDGRFAGFVLGTVAYDIAVSGAGLTPRTVQIAQLPPSVVTGSLVNRGNIPATWTPDMAGFSDALFRGTLTQATTINAPANLTAGCTFRLELTQDAIGNHAVALPTALQISGPIAVNPAANSVTVLGYYSPDGSSLIGVSSWAGANVEYDISSGGVLATRLDADGVETGGDVTGGHPQASYGPSGISLGDGASIPDVLLTRIGVAQSQIAGLLQATAGFRAFSESAPGSSFSSFISGDAHSRLVIDGTGKMSLGNGTGWDTFLERESAGVLKLTGALDPTDYDTSRYNLRVPVLRHAQCVATTNQALSGALPTIDGYTVQDGDRVLLTGQSTGSQNGMWIAHTAGWARPNDYPAAGVVTSRAAFVSGGTIWGGSTWILQSTASVTIDTTATTWTSVGRSAGTGLTLTSNTLAVSYGTAAGTAAQGNDVRLGGVVDVFRSSEVATVSRYFSNSSGTPANQQAFAARAYVRTAGTYTKIRFRTSSVGSGLTDYRACVWDSSGTLITSTANLVSAGAIAQQLFDNQALLASVVVAQGVSLFLGVIGYGSGSPTVPGVNGGATAGAAATALSPVLSWTLGTSWTGGTVPNLSGTLTNFFLPWIELIP